MPRLPIRIVVFTALMAGFSAPAAADQKSDIIRFLGGGEIARLPSSSHGLRCACPDRGGGRAWIASYYGGGERLNRHTASGAVFRPNGLTAAHRTLPLGTKLLVSHAGRSVVVVINDRGPAAWTGRSLDLSRGAASRLAMLGVGVARVNVQVLQ